MNYQTLLYLTCLSIGMICNYHFMFFPEHNRNKPLMNEVSERQGQPCRFWDLRKGWRPSQQEMVSGGKLCFKGTAATLTRFLWSHQNCQGHRARPRSCSLQLPWAAHGYRQPCMRICQKVDGQHKTNGNLSCVQGLLFLIYLKTERSFHAAWILTTVCLLSMY